MVEIYSMGFEGNISMRARNRKLVNGTCSYQDSRSIHIHPQRSTVCSQIPIEYDIYKWNSFIIIHWMVLVVRTIDVMIFIFFVTSQRYFVCLSLAIPKDTFFYIIYPERFLINRRYFDVFYLILVKFCNSYVGKYLI